MSKPLKRCSHYADPQIAVGVKFRCVIYNVAKFFLQQYFTENIDLICTDALGLVGVWQLKAKLKTKCRQKFGLIAKFDLGRDRKIAKIVYRVPVDIQRYRGCRPGIYCDIILQDAFDLKFDI